MYMLRSEIEIPSLGELTQIGKGFHGTVYRYQYMALKILRDRDKLTWDITDDRFNDFVENLQHESFLAPYDTILNEEGVAIGYATYYKPKIPLGKMECQTFLKSTQNLKEGFSLLTKHGYRYTDIHYHNIHSSDRLYLIDFDSCSAPTPFPGYVMTKEELANDNNYAWRKMLMDLLIRHIDVSISSGWLRINEIEKAFDELEVELCNYTIMEEYFIDKNDYLTRKYLQ